MVHPLRSYVLACTPRVGSHLLSDALTSTGIAGRPREWLPRFPSDSGPFTAQDRMRLVTRPPTESPPDPQEDAAHIRRFLAAGTTENGVFGVVVHRLVLQDAVDRFRVFLDTQEQAPHGVLSAAFLGLSYVWLRRRDRVAQAVSWYKAIQTGIYVGRHGGGGGGGESEELRFDYGKIRYLFSAITSFENAWKSYFSSAGVKPLVLEYEDLSEDYVGTVRAVLEFLRLDADRAPVASPRNPKYADARSLAWIEEFNRLHNRPRAGG